MIWLILGSIPVLALLIALIVADWQAFVFSVAVTALVCLGIFGILYGLTQMGVISESG